MEDSEEWEGAEWRLRLVQSFLSQGITSCNACRLRLRSLKDWISIQYIGDSINWLPEMRTQLVHFLSPDQLDCRDPRSWVNRPWDMLIPNRGRIQGFGKQCARAAHSARTITATAINTRHLDRKHHSRHHTRSLCVARLPPGASISTSPLHAFSVILRDRPHDFSLPTFSSHLQHLSSNTRRRSPLVHSPSHSLLDLPTTRSRRVSRKVISHTRSSCLIHLSGNQKQPLL
jgi:hypothetical protein